MRLGESIARRRVFWFLVVLVVGPTIALASYGITGVVDRRTANEARLRDRYTFQVQAMEVGVVARLEQEDARVRQALLEVPPGELPEAVRGLVHGDGIIAEAWLLDDPSLPSAVAAAAASVTLSPVAPVSFLFLPDDSRTIALSRVNEALRVAYEIDPVAIDAVVLPGITGTQFPNEPASYHLSRRTREPDGTPVSLSRLRQDLIERLGEKESLVDRPLAPPFDHWRITVTAADGTKGPGNGRYYGVLALAATTILGVILLGRAIVQQAQLSRLQTDFVSNVSHELRTPLTSIRMFVETLQSGRVQDPEKVKECLEIVATESDRLSRRIERVLSWARMEAGRRIYEFDDARPCDLVARAVASYRAQHFQDTLDVTVDVPEDLPTVAVDREAMEEALLNLLGNARKYGTAAVKIVVTGRAERRWVAISVADDGPGIPRRELNRIFEKFYRPNVLLSRSVQGSGLGLAIVRAVVQVHRGRVDVVSEEGRGARFTIRLPVGKKKPR